jgi:hypothetical protein
MSSQDGHEPWSACKPNVSNLLLKDTLYVVEMHRCSESRLCSLRCFCARPSHAYCHTHIISVKVQHVAILATPLCPAQHMIRHLLLRRAVRRWASFLLVQHCCLMQSLEPFCSQGTTDPTRMLHRLHNLGDRRRFHPDER